MKPTLGWTMLSREEMRLVERSLANGQQDTRDEIGFLLIHQGFADRFFPGTSVLHTRIRYALFVPWVYESLFGNRRRGRTLEGTLHDQLLTLARRLKELGDEKAGIIGGDVVQFNRLSSQPPDRVYWTALRTWGILLPEIGSSSDALRRIAARKKRSAQDDDGGQLDEFESTEVFSGLVSPPADWDDPNTELNFTLDLRERTFLKEKLRNVRRPDDELSLLAKLIIGEATFVLEPGAPLPADLDRYADPTDLEALAVARDAAHLAAIGRMVYGALVEKLREEDGISDARTFRERLIEGFADYGPATQRCDLKAIERFVPKLSAPVRAVLSQTQKFVQAGDPADFQRLLSFYRDAEVARKTPRRARLAESAHSKDRRFEWDPDRHKTPPLHYRWGIVHDALVDLHS
jgi:hypothetical protein